MKKEKWSTVFYLFLETLSLLMVFSILFLSPDVSDLSRFERFGYATASLGGVLFILKLKSVKTVKPTQKIILTIILYPLLLWCLYETVHRSPELLNEQLKSRALKVGVSTLSREKNGYFEDDVTDFSLRFMPSDTTIKALHFAAFSSLGAIAQEREKWHVYFDRAQFENYVRGTSHLNRKYHLFDQRFNGAYFSSLLSGGGWLALSRTTTQLALLEGVSEELFVHRLKDNAEAYLIAVGALPRVYVPERERWAIQDARIGAVVSRKIIESLNGKGGDVLFKQYAPSDSWELSVRKSLTQNVLKKAALSGADLDGVIAFPWHGGAKGEFEKEFHRIAFWNAPFLFNEQKLPLLSLSTFYSEQENKRYLQHFNDDTPLSPGIREAFNRFFSRHIHNVVEQHGWWSAPITPLLFNDIVRVGAILPFMLILSIFLTFFNLYTLWKSSGVVFLYGMLSSAIGAAVFLTPIKDPIIRLVTFFSVPESALF